MDAERHGLADRRPPQVRRQALLVEPVSSLVQDAEKTRTEITFLVPPGQPHVSGPHTDTERVRGLVQTPTLEVEADRRRHFAPETLLDLRRELAEGR